MNQKFKNFLLKSGLTALIFFIIGFVLFYFNDIGWYHHAFIYVLIAYMFFSWGIQFALYHFVAKSPAVFNRAFLLITAIKLVVLIAIMVLIAFQLPHIFKYFLGELLILYLAYSIIEIQDILGYIKKLKS